MTFVVELRDLMKGLPRPVIHFWQRAADDLCALRVRVALLGVLGLLGLSLDCPLGASGAAGGVPALLCGVLCAAVSATLGLLQNASSDLYALFSDDASPAFRLGQRLSPCFGEPLLSFDTCPEAGLFPVFSWHSTLALAICACLLLGCGPRRKESPEHGS
jgi:hypothetical protein